jgi:hypothetical protein
MPDFLNGDSGSMPESFSSIESAAQFLKDDDDQDQSGQQGQPSRRADGEDQGQADDQQGQEGTEPGDELDLSQLSEEELAALEAANQDEQQPRGGTFAGHNQQVKLADGTTTTVAQLLADRTGHGDLMQRETTFRQEQEKFGQAKAQVGEAYQQMQRDRQVIAAIAQTLLPQEPDIAMMANDPHSYHILKAAYDKQVKMIQHVVGQFQANEEKSKGDHDTELKAFREEQGRKLVQRVPSLGTQEGWQAHWGDIFKYGGRVFGYTADELRNGISDHRQHIVMRYAIAHAKNLAKAAEGNKGGRKAPNGQQQPQRVMNQPSRPGNPAAAKAKAAKARFDKNPSIKSAMDLDF